MEAMSTSDVVRELGAQGYRITRKRLEGFLATGRVRSPMMVGPTRVWLPDDVARVREALIKLDGAPHCSEEHGLASTPPAWETR